MAKKNLTIENVEPLLLFGSNDRYLKKVEAAFPKTTITARGNKVVLQGGPSEIQSIERVINELVTVLQKNNSLTENDVETVLAIEPSGESDTGEHPATNGDTILHTPSGNVIKAKTPNQKVLVATARNNDLVFAIGPAGTGKTYTAVALAVAALKSRKVRRIVLSRPAVEAGERLGFLPGDFRDKVDPYLRPLYDALGDMIHQDKLATYIDQNIVEIVPLAYMRGRTLDSAFVILDEAQNATRQQMKMFLTRLGPNSRAIVTGDASQIDLPKRSQSGLIEAKNILAGVEGIDFVTFGRTDVLRHRLVKEIIEAYEAHEEEKEG